MHRFLAIKDRFWLYEAVFISTHLLWLNLRPVGAHKCVWKLDLSTPKKLQLFTALDTWERFPKFLLYCSAKVVQLLLLLFMTQQGQHEFAPAQPLFKVLLLTPLLIHLRADCTSTSWSPESPLNSRECLCYKVHLSWHLFRLYCSISDEQTAPETF